MINLLIQTNVAVIYVQYIRAVQVKQGSCTIVFMKWLGFMSLSEQLNLLIHNTDMHLN